MALSIIAWVVFDVLILVIASRLALGYSRRFRAAHTPVPIAVRSECAGRKSSLRQSPD